MLTLHDLKDDDQWLNRVHYVLNLREQNNKTTAIVQAFIEVKVGTDVYTFVQQSATVELSSYSSTIGRLIAGLRLQMSIALWRARGFNKLKTVRLEGSAVFVNAQDKYPTEDISRTQFVNALLLDALHRSVIMRAKYFDQFSAYPYLWIPIENKSSAFWNSLNRSFESRIQPWRSRDILSKSEAADTILPLRPFEFVKELADHSEELQALGVPSSLTTETEARRVLNLAVVYPQQKPLPKRAEVASYFPTIDVPIPGHVIEGERAEPVKRTDIIDMTPASENNRRLALVRRGRNDLEIEVFRDNAWTPSYISDLRPDEFFLIMEESPYGKVPEGRCFQVRGRVQIFPSINPNDPSPNFMIPGLTIATAPETSENNRLLASLSRASVGGSSVTHLFDNPDNPNYNQNYKETDSRSRPASELFDTKPATPSE